MKIDRLESFARQASGEPAREPVIAEHAEMKDVGPRAEVGDVQVNDLRGGIRFVDRQRVWCPAAREEADVEVGDPQLPIRAAFELGGVEVHPEETATMQIFEKL